MDAEEIFTYECDECGETVECIGVTAVYALEYEWHISPFRTFCSGCRQLKTAAAAIETENRLIEKRINQAAAN